MKKPTRRRIKIDGTYDIECHDWTEFVCGGYLKANGDYHLYSEHKSAPMYRGADAMRARLRCDGGTIWAHSGGTYDHKWLIDGFARDGEYASISAAGARIVTAQIGHLALRDSWALVPVSLKELTAGMQIHKEELDLPCICEDDFGENCGGYCSIARDMPRAQYKRLCDYLEADNRSLYGALIKVQEYGDENDLDLGATVGSSSWRTVKRLLEIPDAEMSADEHAFARRGYYGGRVQNVWPGEHRNFHESDVSSMYPWTLKTFAMPVGDYTMRYGTDAKRCLYSGVPGIYDCVVNVPDSLYLPPLPYRAATRIAYPTGRFRDVWPLPELEFALSQGVTIETVIQGMTWIESRVLFTPFVDSLFALRKAAGKTTPVGIWLKFMLNSLTGKFGSNPEKERWFVNPRYLHKCSAVQPCRLNGAGDCGECCFVHCTKRCGAMAEHSQYIWSEYAYKLDSCAHIEFAAYLTSHARVETCTQMLSVDGGRHVIYCDTDGVQGYRKLTRRMGSECGEWEYKGQFEYGNFIAPKTYYRKEAKGIVAKAKGVGAPKDKPLRIGHLYKPKGVAGLKQGANLGTLFTPNYKLRKGRTIQMGAGDRVFVSPGSYETRAPRIEEVSTDSILALTA